MVLLVLDVQHHPVVHTPEFMRTGRVREQRSEVPARPLCVQHRQPGLAFRVESSRRDQRQASGLRQASVLLVHREQRLDRRLRARLRLASTTATATPAVQHLGQGGTNGSRTPRPDARQGLQPTGLGQHLQALERVDAQSVVQAVGQRGADAGNGAQQGLRGRSTTQPLQLGPVAAVQQFGDGGGDAGPDAGQGIQPRQTGRLVHVPHRSIQARHRVGGVPVGGHAERVVTLCLQQHRHLPQGLCDLAVVAGGSGWEQIG